MTRIIATAACTFVLVLFFYVANGGALGPLIQPHQFGIILVTIVGSTVAAGRLRLWGGIFADIGLLGRTHESRMERFTMVAAHGGAAGTETRPLTHVPFDRQARAVATVRSAATAATVGGLLGTLLSGLRIAGAIAEPPEVLGHLFGASLVAMFLGLAIAQFLLVPLAAALADLYADAQRAGGWNDAGARPGVGPGATPLDASSHAGDATAAIVEVLILLFGFGALTYWLIGS